MFGPTSTTGFNLLVLKTIYTLYQVNLEGYKMYTKIFTCVIVKLILDIVYIIYSIGSIFVALKTRLYYILSIFTYTY